jgi:acetyl-CoA carboxylase biotin carboxyl carrier protein
VTGSGDAAQGGLVARAEDADLLEWVRGTALALLGALPWSPERLRVQARDIVIELGWPMLTPGVATTAPGSAPVISHDGELGLVAPGITGNGRAVAADARVTAPTVGTFYRRPHPAAGAFVEVGDRVTPGQQVAIVEAMKLMLPVQADAEGVITEVLAEDGQPVEYGQALFALGPVS